MDICTKWVVRYKKSIYQNANNSDYILQGSLNVLYQPSSPFSFKPRHAMFITFLLGRKCEDTQPGRVPQSFKHVGLNPHNLTSQQQVSFEFPGQQNCCRKLGISLSPPATLPMVISLLPIIEIMGRGRSELPLIPVVRKVLVHTTQLFTV